MRKININLFLYFIILLSISACQKKVKNEFRYNKLSQNDLNFVPYHVGDTLDLKDQNSGLITQFTCNHWKIDSIVTVQGCTKDDNFCTKICSEYLIIKLGTTTSDSIFNLNFRIESDTEPSKFQFQTKTGSFLFGDVSPHTYAQPYTVWNDSLQTYVITYIGGQIYLDSIVSNSKVFKNVNCYYYKRYYYYGVGVDSLYFTSTEGIVRLVLPNENKIFVQ